MKRILSLVMAWAVTMTALLPMTGCGGKKDAYTPVPGLNKEQQATIRIAIPYETNKALNTVANAFMTKYPNVNVQLTFIEDYDTNALQLFKDNAMDVILQKDVLYAEYTVKDAQTGEKIPTGTTPEDFFYNFAADDEIDFSDTTPDLTDNYLHTRIAEDGSEVKYQYSYPMGGEVRGVYVNTTFLDSFGLSIPTNYTEFVQCCETIQQAGYTPIQGNISTLAYGLGIAQAANTVVHNAEALAAMAAAEEGVSGCFADTIGKIYELCTNRFCDYKALEEAGLFANSGEYAQASDFLGLSYNEDDYEIRKPENNSGYVAFFPYISSTQTVIEDLIEENGLDTAFQFICAPLNDEGSNSPVYITPYYGVCANKNSENLIWIREFVNFLFQEETIKTYAENAAIIPNTTDAIAYVADQYGLDTETDITLCGQIYFSTGYNGFTPLAAGILSTAKCNAPKYMADLNRDAAGNIQYEQDENGREFLYLGNGETAVFKEAVAEEDPAMPGFAFCTLQYYLDVLEAEFGKYRAGQK